MPYIRLRKDPSVSRIFFQFYFTIQTFRQCVLSIDYSRNFTLIYFRQIFRDLLITGCRFICFYELFHHRFFQFLNSFRFEEFPSVLRSIYYLIDNKQINFNCFFGILPTKSRVSLKFVTNKLNISCFCLNLFHKITSANGIALRRHFDILSIWYTSPITVTPDSFCDPEN